MTHDSGSNAAPSGQGRPTPHADVDEKSGPENQNRGSHRDRGAGDPGQTSSFGDHRPGGNGGVPGGTVPTDRSGERESRPGDGSGSSECGRHRVETSRFGNIEVPQSAIIEFPHGIPGFPASCRYVLLDHREDSIFRWLQSVDQGELAFVVLDPLLIDQDYPIDAITSLLHQLDVCQDEEILVLGICTVPPPPGKPTVNLLAPLGIGVHQRIGAQVVLHNTPYSAQTEFLDAEKAA